MKIAKNRLHNMKAYISFVSQYTVAHKYPYGTLKFDQEMVDENYLLSTHRVPGTMRGILEDAK